LSIAVLAWGVSFIATKVALREVAPITVVWLRFALGLPVLVLAARARGALGGVPRRTLVHFAGLGLLGIALHQWLQSTALVTARASSAAWLVTTAPVFIALLGRVFLGERLPAARAAGNALAAAGVLLVVAGAPGAAPGAPAALGDWLILLSALNWAVFSVLSRRGLREHAPAKMMLYVMVAGFAVISIQFAASGRAAEIGRLSTAGWGAVGFLGLVCSGLAYMLWYQGLEVLPAARAGAFLYLEPLATMVAAPAVLGERVGPATLAGGALILGGVWAVNRPARPGRPALDS